MRTFLSLLSYHDMSKYVRWKSLKSAVTNSCLFRRQITNFAIFLSLTHSILLILWADVSTILSPLLFLCFFISQNEKKKCFSYVCGESWWQKQPQCIYIVRRKCQRQLFYHISRQSWQLTINFFLFLCHALFFTRHHDNRSFFVWPLCDTNCIKIKLILFNIVAR